jgi:uncharacterized RDD family membrane protein YckC
MPSLHFETPENVQVQYEPAGLGTRFIAWFVDQVIVWVGTVLVIILLIIAGVSFVSALADIGDSESRDEMEAIMYFVGMMMLIWSLGSWVYFGGSELLLRGQTVGKRVCKIRVIKANGFQLDAGSILVRTFFRVVDHLPPMWLFPLISRLHQRAGDMVAGTIVVNDSITSFSPVRTELGTRTAGEAEFRFDASKLKLLSANDFQAVERILERLPTLTPDAKLELLLVYTSQIAKKLSIDPPPIPQQQRFLEDLFAAELRRQDRQLA